MHYFRVILVIVFCVSYSRTLVHFTQLKKGANGCITNAGENLKVGEYAQDEKVCGVIRCESKEGKGLIFYCTEILPFARCSEYEYISTETPFPRCCFTCVTGSDCFKETGKPGPKD